MSFLKSRLQECLSSSSRLSHPSFRLAQLSLRLSHLLFPPTSSPRYQLLRSKEYSRSLPKDQAKALLALLKRQSASQPASQKSIDEVSSTSPSFLRFDASLLSLPSLSINLSSYETSSLFSFYLLPVRPISSPPPSWTFTFSIRPSITSSSTFPQPQLHHGQFTSPSQSRHPDNGPIFFQSSREPTRSILSLDVPRSNRRVALNFSFCMVLSSPRIRHPPHLRRSSYLPKSNSFFVLQTYLKHYYLLPSTHDAVLPSSSSQTSSYHQNPISSLHNPLLQLLQLLLGRRIPPLFLFLLRFLLFPPLLFFTHSSDVGTLHPSPPHPSPPLPPQPHFHSPTRPSGGLSGGDPQLGKVGEAHVRDRCDRERERRSRSFENYSSY